ncbi:MAG: hypothetical protein Q9182_007625, partial [Xanthomendoza sp. 2 TL-2023]
RNAAAGLQVACAVPALAEPRRQLTGDAPATWGPSACPPGTIWSTTSKKPVAIPHPSVIQQKQITACNNQQKYTVLKGGSANSPMTCTADGGVATGAPEHVTMHALGERGGNPVAVNVANNNILSPQSSTGSSTNTVGSDSGNANANGGSVAAGNNN